MPAFFMKSRLEELKYASFEAKMYLNRKILRTWNREQPHADWPRRVHSVRNVTGSGHLERHAPGLGDDEAVPVAALLEMRLSANGRRFGVIKGGYKHRVRSSTPRVWDSAQKQGEDSPPRVTNKMGRAHLQNGPDSPVGARR